MENHIKVAERIGQTTKQKSKQLAKKFFNISMKITLFQN